MDTKTTEPRAAGECPVSTGYEIHLVGKVSGGKHDGPRCSSPSIVLVDFIQGNDPPTWCLDKYDGLNTSHFCSLWPELKLVIITVLLLHVCKVLTPFSHVVTYSDSHGFLFVSAVVRMWEDHGAAGPEQDRPSPAAGGHPQPGQLLQGANSRAESKGT